MGIFSKFGAGIVGGIAKEVADVAKEYIEDPDVRNKVIEKIIVRATDLEIERTKAKTIPWVDALHKMSRVILAGMLMVVYLVLELNDVDVDIGELATMAGPAGLYTLLKGRGR